MHGTEQRVGSGGPPCLVAYRRRVRRPMPPSAYWASRAWHGAEGSVTGRDILHAAEVLIGGVWIATSFIGTDSRRFAKQLRAAGADPRAAGPSLWIQRLMGAALVALGVVGFVHP